MHPTRHESNFLKQIYYNIKNTSSFSSLKELTKVAKKLNPKLHRSTIKVWLIKQPTYQQHKPAPNKFKRAKIYVPRAYHTFEIDLADMSRVAKVNDGYKY